MRTLVGQLHSWQRREWLYRAVWGFARWLVVVFIGVFVACLIDWLVDRRMDTPLFLRVLMTLGQVVFYGLAAFVLLFRLRTPSIIALATRAERKIPEFDHRLVTSLQLNRPNAKTKGMSPELIREVTREAEQLSSRKNLASLANPKRLLWALLLVIPPILFAGIAALAAPQLVTALLTRQLLMSAEIPRRFHLENETKPLWPSGDEAEIRIAVTGPVTDDTTGYVIVQPEGQPTERYALTLVEKTETSGIYTAKMPPSTAPFKFRAWVGDGRMRDYGKVTFEPRPVVKEIEAWVLLPLYVDPEKKNRYERSQSQGEVLTSADSAIRVAITTSKPVAKAVLVLFNRDDEGREKEYRRFDMDLSANRDSASYSFELPPRPSGYQIEVTDDHGFTNTNSPRRGITLAPDEPPRVNLLNEVLKDPREEGPLDDFEVNGMPLAIGGQVLIGYAARSPLGISRALIAYRVNEGPWLQLPLRQVVVDPAKLVGKFLPELGVFEQSGAFGQVEFYPIPAVDPDAEPSGLEAGGRYSFQTAAITKTTDSGATTKLEVGDRVEFYVEVYDRNPAKNRQPGRSESRLKTVVTQGQLQAWLDQRDQSRDRLRQIEERQRGVFVKPKQ